MNIQISGKNIELGESLQGHVGERLTESVKKYFDRGAEANVVFAREKRNVECDVTAHLASGVFLAAHGRAGDAYGAFEECLEKLEKRVRRYKRRLKDHHANGKAPLPALDASLYVLEPLKDETEAEATEGDPIPVVVAESQTQLREMTVGAAVMQLDLAEQPAVIFRNAAHGRVNVVYRRPDGHIGWVDPSA
ncbi:MAG: ribosome-associated translation inhibitor RaiA [Pseudomonadota bacterium]